MKSVTYLILVALFVIISCNKDDCDKPDRCSLEPEQGPCEAIFAKYYYNPDKKKCEEFIWGGCDGVVPFETLEECWECECAKRLE